MSKIPYYQQAVITNWTRRIKKAHITWKKLSELSGISGTTISQVKNFKTKPHKNTLNAVERAFYKLGV